MRTSVVEPDPTRPCYASSSKTDAASSLDCWLVSAGLVHSCRISGGEVPPARNALVAATFSLSNVLCGLLLVGGVVGRFRNKLVFARR